MLENGQHVVLDIAAFDSDTSGMCAGATNLVYCNVIAHSMRLAFASFGIRVVLDRLAELDTHWLVLDVARHGVQLAAVRFPGNTATTAPVRPVWRTTVGGGKAGQAPAGLPDAAQAHYEQLQTALSRRVRDGHAELRRLRSQVRCWQADPASDEALVKCALPAARLHCGYSR